MMLDYIGWNQASDLIREALKKTIAKGTVTYDLARQIKGAKKIKCSEFAGEIVKKIA
jgi:isocitrate dehydrogenase